MVNLSEKRIKELIRKTRENLRLAGRSDETIKNYSYALSSFFKNCDYKGKLSSFTEENFMDYINKEFIKKHKSSNTYNLYIAAIKKMFIVCYKKKFINELIPIAKTKRRLPYIIPKDDYLRILNKEDKLNHKCWLLLGFCCGLRACEIATVKIENINAKEHTLRVIGKGNKERITILPDIVTKFLRLYYIEKKLIDKEGFIFKSSKGSDLEHVNPRTIINFFTNLKDNYSLDNRYTLHSLRHSFATYFLMNGGNLVDLQHMMGHKSLQSTEIYLHISQDFKNMKGINYGK